MFDFDDLGQGAKEGPARVESISVKEMTVLDEITDIGWLEGETKQVMAAKFLSERGQYFDNGTRVIASE